MNEVFDNIDACLRTRELSARSLLDTLRSIGDRSYSEKEVKDIWQRKLFDSQSVFEKGWYEPPTDGIAILASDEAQPYRLDFSSLRDDKYWPSSSVYLAKEKASYFYCSPIEKTRGIIGDFGVTLYTGTDEKTIEHLKKTLTITKKIAEHAEVGMEMKELFEFASSLFDEFKVENLDSGVTDTNINLGHTMPWTNEVMTDEEKAILKGGNWEELKGMISKKRIFLNGIQKFKIQENMVFSIEPKLKSSLYPHIPAANFHTLVVFKGGEKNIPNTFSEIFKEWGMDYMEGI